MKYISTLFPATLLLLAFASCEDSFLDRYPKDSTNSKVFFSTGSDLQLYTDQFYTILPEASELYGEVSDEVATTNLPPEVMGTRTITSGDEYWNWDMLRHINYFLEHSHQCDEIEERRHYEGVAYFFRAYFYFEKIKKFGDVPWYDHPVGSSDTKQLNKPRDSRKSVTENIIADLNKAIDMLPDGHSTYTINRWTALALKSRICLFEGTFRKYHQLGDSEELLRECATEDMHFIKPERSHTAIYLQAMIRKPAKSFCPDDTVPLWVSPTMRQAIRSLSHKAARDLPNASSINT